MKNVSKIIPCYAADTSGVCSALYELGGMTVVHDASGCNSTYSTHDEPRWEHIDSNIFISALTEIDAIMGNDEKLIADTVSAAHDRKPSFITVCGSPMPMMTGVDFDAVAAEIQNRSGILTIPLHTNGTHSYIKGADEALCEVVKAFATPQEKIKNGVNVLGLTPLDFPLGDDKKIKAWLNENGFECICTLAMGAALEDISRMPAAEVNLVVSYSGISAAKFLKDEYGIPYVFGVPVGKGFAKTLASALKSKTENPFAARKGGKAAVIGESIFSLSLAAALNEDMGLGADVISPLPAEASLLLGNDSTLFAEEDIEELLKEKAPDMVIADPLYKYIIPKNSRLVPLPHFAFSGRCFEKDMKSLINTDIGELFK